MRTRDAITLSLACGAMLVACEREEAPLDRRGACPTEWRAYPYAPAGTDIRFPEDEGAHYPSDLSVEMEWWYTIWHLVTADGRAFSIMSTFFMPQLDIAYRPFNVTDVQNGVMADSGLWGELEAAEGHVDLLWHDPTAGVPDSYLRHRRDGAGDLVPFGYEQELHYVSTEEATASHSLSLTIDSLKPPLLVGGDGFVTIGSSGDSWYYSLTHLQARGTLTVGGESFAVTGYGWLDHQWGPFMLNPTPLSKNSYEWFALHLDNGQEYMVSTIFDQQGRTHAEPGFGSIGWVNADCTQGYTLDYTFERLGYWMQPVTGNWYSHGWRIVVPEQGVDLLVTPVIEDQTVIFISTYFYEGRSHVQGTVGGLPVEGLAFAELVHHYHPPIVQITAPAAGPVTAGPVAVTWSVVNADDGLPLGFTVTGDGGTGAESLCPETADTSCLADLSGRSGPLTVTVAARSVDGAITGSASVSVTVE